MEGRWKNVAPKVKKMEQALPGRHCSLFCSEPDADRVCLNTPFFFFFFLIYIHVFFSLPASLFLAFRGVIPHRWRSDTFDNSGPCGVNTEVIACCSPSLFARICPHIRMPFHRLADKEEGEGGGWGWGAQRKLKL